MPDPSPPDVLTLRWCPKCEGWEFPEELRFPADQCPGAPRELTYILASNPKPNVCCETMGHEGVPAVRYVSCEGDGRYPYCADCANTLINAGEIDHGPVLASNPKDDD